MNAGNFIVGLVFGYLLHNKINLDKFKGKLITIISIILYFLVPAFTKFMFQINTIEPSIGTALYGAYLKHHEGIFLSIILLNLLFQTKCDCLTKFFRLPVFEVFDKLFVPAFFSHLVMTKIFIASTKVLIQISFINMVN